MTSLGGGSVPEPKDHGMRSSSVFRTLGAGGVALTVRLRGIRAAVQGNALPLAVALEHLHLFDPDSGQRLN